MELIEQFKNDLNNIKGNPEYGITTVDIRINMSRKGTKVYIEFGAKSTAQKKPLPTFTEAFKNALETFSEHIVYQLKYNRKELKKAKPEWKYMYERNILNLTEAKKVAVNYLKKF